MADTVQPPGGDAAVVRVHGSNKALAATTDVTPRYCKANPFEGAKQAVAEAWRNLTAVGAHPLAITDNLNFGNPEKPEIMGEISACIEGIAEACGALEFPDESAAVRTKASSPSAIAVAIISGARRLRRRSTTVGGRTVAVVGASAEWSAATNSRHEP